MIGKRFGNLVVIGYDEAARTATVRCECGNIETRKSRSMLQGRVRNCQACRDHAKYLESIKVDMKRLAKLEPAIVVQVLKAWAQHLAACRRQKVRAASFATFVTEALMDPDLFNREEMDQSFEARYLRSNPQSYRQYQRPAELI